MKTKAATGKKTIFEISEDYFKNPYTYFPEYRKPINSWKLLGWIASYSNLTNLPRLVAFEIASYYRPATGYCYPTYEQISEKTGLSQRSISSAIQQMKLSGEWLVVPVGRKNYTRSISNRYFPLSPLQQGYLDPKTNLIKLDSINQIGNWVPCQVFQDVQAYKQNFYKLIGRYKSQNPNNYKRDGFTL